MIEYVTTIDNFWKDSIEDFKYSRSVPYESMTYQKDKWHKNFHIGNLLQAFENELPIFYKNFSRSLQLNENIPTMTSWICIVPNQIIGPHNDSFFQLRKKYNDPDISQCRRYLIFLEDWVFGQIVEFKSKTIRNWSNGDVWIFDSTETHWAGNASNFNFHTCQVSTFTD